MPQADSNPTVSVLMPAYNAERFLVEAVESVLSQEFGDLELIVCDDGSADGTRAVLDRITDPRLRVLAQEHRGLVTALNAALDRARGRFIARLDADDVWERHLLSTLIPLLEEDPDLGLVYARCTGILADGAASGEQRGTPLRYPEDPIKSLVLCDHTACVTSIAPRAVVAALGGWREDAEGSEDWDFSLRLAQHYSVRFVDRELARIREHPGATTAVGRPGLAQRLRVRRAVVGRVFEQPDLTEPIRRLRTPALRNLHVGEGLQWLVLGDLRRAGSAFRRALRDGGNPLRTLGRIGWSSFDWFCLDRLPGARRSAERVLAWSRGRPAAAARKGG